MDCEVKYQHFVPNQTERQKCSELINLVIELSPSDSNVLATADRVSDGTFKTSIAVNGISGNFDAESSDLSLLASLQKSQRQVLENIDHWKRQRFD